MLKVKFSVMTKKSLNLISFFALLLSTQFLYSQDVNQKIIDAYGSDYVNNFVKTNKNRLSYLSCFLSSSFEFIKIKPDVNDKFPLASNFFKKKKSVQEISYVPNVNDFNVLMYNFPRNRNLKTTYRIDKTDYVIVFYSENEFAEILNNYRNKYNFSMP